MTKRSASISIPSRDFTRHITRYQRNALAAFDEGRARYAMLEWHRRARKTTLALNLLIREAVRHEKRTYRYLAPTRAAARAIVWDDPNMLFKYLPDQDIIPWRANQQSLSIFFGNQSRIVVNGADNMKDRQRGGDTHGIVFDEWAFHENADIWHAVYRPQISLDGERWAWFLFTPNGMNFATEMYDLFAKSETGDTYCRSLKASASRLVPEGELRRAALEMPHGLYMQEFECERLMTHDMVLIQPMTIERLEAINHGFTTDRRIISCDPAFEGDECGIMAMRNTDVLDELYAHPQTTDEIIGLLVQMGAKHQIDDFIIDPIGIGKGVVDGMRQNPRFRVQEFDARRSPTGDDERKRRFANLRAEAWWYVWDELAAGRARYIRDAKTRQQLCSVRYKCKNNGALALEPKLDIRNRLGESPDRADTYVMAMWGSRNLEPYTPYNPKAAAGDAYRLDSSVADDPMAA